MSLEEKLNQIRTLLAERDEIDRQLEVIVGHSGTRTNEPNGYVPATTTRKNKKSGSNKSRYDGDDARRNEGIMQALRAGEKPRHVAKQFKVSVQTVYNIKSRSKSVHAKAQQATREAQAEPEARPASKALSPDEYDAVRDAMFDRGFSSAEHALTNRLSPREVNTAIRSNDYDDYLAIR